MMDEFGVNMGLERKTQNQKGADIRSRHEDKKNICVRRNKP